jgi:branched-chain amino acid transport system ATP-binding protein
MALLETRQLTKRFKGLTALDRIDIEVHDGEILGIIGPNGAGKTTLFNVISGLIRPSHGEILFQGQNLAGMKPHSIAKRGIVRTFQGAGLFQATSCLENLLIAHELYKSRGFWQTMLNVKSYRSREEEVRRKSLEMLERMNLNDKRHLLTQDIPYGHQKMLGLAMAMATDAQLFLLDEPVAGMNPIEAVAIIERIAKIREKQKKTIVIVEHNMKVIMGGCDRIVVLDHGIKIAEGSPEDIRINQRVIEAYLGTEET